MAMVDFLHFSEKYRHDIYANLRRLVEANSFSANLDGVAAVAEMLQKIAAQHRIPFEIVVVEENGERRPHLLYCSPHQEGYYALVGHFDTVHPPQSDFRQLSIEGENLVGPGVNDMKAGLLVALYAMVVLQERIPLAEIPVRILFNADEEIGSPGSRKIMASSLAGARAGFVFEAGRWPGNRIVTRRKGKWSLEVEVFGQPSHAGDAPQTGVNAIVAAAAMICRLNGLNEHQTGLTVVCSLVSGGVARNVVPDYCSFSADIRVPDQTAGKMIKAAVAKILQPDQDNLRVTFALEERRPPLIRSEATGELVTLYRQVSERYGLPCDEVVSGGVSDANLLSSYGMPCLDGLGAVGQFPHTGKEYIVAESLIQRVAIFSDFLYRLLTAKRE
jgi:glutamate carboxypeptidase